MTLPAFRQIPPTMRVLRSIVRRFRRTRARLSIGSRVRLSPDTAIGPRARWLAQRPVVVGKRVSIGADFFVESGLVVGDDVLISSRVACILDDHQIDLLDIPVTLSPRNMPADVVLLGDNLVGHGTIIVGPSKIGRGTIIGAGSLVIGDLPGESICLGRPAKPVRKRSRKVLSSRQYESMQ